MNSHSRFNSDRVLGCLLVGIFIIVTSCGRPSWGYSRVTYFPTNATGETALYKLFVTVDYGLRKAHSNISDKEVSIEIDNKNTLLVHKVYSIKGAELDWKVDWDELSSLQIRFYERIGATNVLRTMTFRIDPSTDQVDELEKAESAHHD